MLQNLLRKLLPILVSLLFCLPVYSQIRSASPYSVFGLGDLSDNNNAWNLSMGNLSMAMRGPGHINYANPASYTAFDSMSFVFEGGFNLDVIKLTSDYQTENRTFGSVGYFLFGLPVTKWWRSSFGLVPFSRIGYEIATVGKVDQTMVVQAYTGSGGINRFYWGNGFKILKNLHVGFNASYLFGSMDRKTNVIFPDSVVYMNFELNNMITMNDLLFNFGVQYGIKLKDDLKLTLGGVFSNQSNMSAKVDFLARTYLPASDGGITYKDTLAMGDNFEGDIVIPIMIGAGFAFDKNEKWTAGVDYKWQNWKKYKAFNLTDTMMTNSYMISAGAEFLPDINSYTSYFKRVRYRVGFLYNSTYLQINGVHLNEYAVTFGFGLPLRGMKTAINLSAQLGSRGTTQDDLIKESYFKFTLGFSVFERWFVKRKYY